MTCYGSFSLASLHYSAVRKTIWEIEVKLLSDVLTVFEVFTKLRFISVLILT